MRRRRVHIAAGLVILWATLTSVPAQGATPHPQDDPFYKYTGATPLKDIAPGTVLKTRTSTISLNGIPLPIPMVQLLYRTTDVKNRPVTTVASVLKPPTPVGTPRLMSYQSFYDALTPLCEPSYVLNGGTDPGFVATGEMGIATGPLLQGYTFVTADFELQDPAFATGPLYGPATLDAIRAALASPAVGLPANTPVGMIGYSGGAIATEWATEMAPSYAPDVNNLLVGSAMGGVLVNPIRNLDYISGSTNWAGVMAMAFIGVSKAYEVDLSPYLSDYGKQVYSELQDTCIFNVYGQQKYSGLTFAQLVKPQYANPRSISLLIKTTNKLIMGRTNTPTVPLFIRQGTGGEAEGTPGNKPGIGPGDGVMIAGDVRTLARQYCDDGVDIDFREDAASHVPEGLTALTEGFAWLNDRFAGVDPPNTCDSIAAGNPIDPLPVPPDTPTPTPTPTDRGDSDSDSDDSDSDDSDSDSDDSDDSGRRRRHEITPLVVEGGVG